MEEYTCDDCRRVVRRKADYVKRHAFNRIISLKKKEKPTIGEAAVHVLVLCNLENGKCQDHKTGRKCGCQKDWEEENPTVNLTKVRKVLRTFAKKHGISAKVQKKILESLSKEDNYGVSGRERLRFEIDKDHDPDYEDSICLYIGKADFQWDLKGSFIGSGTGF